MQGAIKTDNTIRLFTYDDAIAIYKQQQKQAKINTREAIKNYLINHYILQKIKGLVTLVSTIIFSFVVGEGNILIFMIPACMALMLTND